MTAPRIDRRAARTRHALTESFVSLVRARGYGEVSVSDLCATADVGRSTFYAHYADKDDLKRRAMTEHLRTVVARGSDGVAADDPLGFSLSLLNHARDCLDLRRAGAGTAGERIAWEVLSEIVHGEVRKALAGSSRTRPDHSAEAAVALVAGGWLALHRWWLARGAHLPESEVDAIFRRFAALEAGPVATGPDQQSPGDTQL